MKIIIAYASAGAGHFKAAEAVYNHLKQDKNHTVKLIDALDQSNPLFRNFYRSGYDFMVKHFPSFWALCYFITHIKVLRPVAHRLRLAINRANTQEFSRFLRDLNPDCILSTHFLSSEIAAYLKNKKRIQSRLFTAITDFGVHSFWVAQGSDGYFVACDYTKKELVKEGVASELIHAVGIPIDSKFSRPLLKKEICTKLGLNENRFTALVMTGSFGIGPLEEIVDLLHQDIQMLVVCARNERLYSRLKSKNYPSVKIFGFIDNPEELMSVADIIITKAGGLSVAEFLAREVVPVFICAIPGQEKTNIRVLASYGIGGEVKTCQQLKGIVLGYKEHPEELARIKQKIRQIRKPFAAKELSDAICQSCCGPTSRGSL